jgi:hypothetical protein
VSGDINIFKIANDLGHIDLNVTAAFEFDLNPP